MDNLLAERQLELAWEGWRRQDLIRFGQFTRSYNSRPQLPNEESGYTPFYVSHYGRHGSRYLIGDRDYKWLVDLFEEAHREGALSDLGEDTRQRLLKVWEEAEGHGGDLTPLGVRQHRGIAERMYAAFPEAFKGNPSISARSTVVLRCAMSMVAFGVIKKCKISGNRLIGLCPFHNDSNPSFSVDLTTGQWICFTENIKGNYINFYSRYYNITEKEAYKEILKKYNKYTNDYTIEDYCLEKRLPIEWLKNHYGIQTSKNYDGRQYVKMPYYNENMAFLHTVYRHSFCLFEFHNDF